MVFTKDSCIPTRAPTGVFGCTKKPPRGLFALVHIGTPVDIANSQPEDATFGKKIQTLDQSRDPDPPRSVLMSPSWFKDPPGPLLIDGAGA